MIRSWPDQDPQANLDYWFDLNPAVLEQGSPLESYTLSISGSDTSLTKSGEVLSANVLYFWLKGPTEFVKYTVTCHFKLVNGYEDDMSMTLTGANQ